MFIVIVIVIVIVVVIVIVIVIVIIIIIIIIITIIVAVVVAVEYIIILIIIIVVVIDSAQLQFCQTVHLESLLSFKPLIFPRKVISRLLRSERMSLYVDPRIARIP